MTKIKNRSAARTRKRMKEAANAARCGDLVNVGSPNNLLRALNERKKTRSPYYAKMTAAEVERYLFDREDDQWSDWSTDVSTTDTDIEKFIDEVRHPSKKLLPPNPFLEIGDPEKQTLINNDW